MPFVNLSNVYIILYLDFYKVLVIENLFLLVSINYLIKFDVFDLFLPSQGVHLVGGDLTREIGEHI